jgi:hypothetical protein
MVIIKQNTFYLEKEQLKLFEEKVPKSNRRSALEEFIFNHYNPDQIDEGIIDDGVTKNLRFTDEASKKIKDMANRFGVSSSSLLRDVIKKFNIFYNNKEFSQEKKSVTYYLHSGTRQLLDLWIDGHKDRSFKIERFLIDDNFDELQIPDEFIESPEAYEPIRMKMGEQSLKIISQMAKVNNVNQSVVMRFVIARYIETLSKQPFLDLLLRQQLENTIYQYKKISSDQNKVEELLSDYLSEEKK